MTDESLTPEMLLQAYAAGIFPMAEARDDPEVFWVDPQQRGILPLDGFHMARSLARTLRQNRFEVSFNSVFSAVMDGCADRDETWINPVIRDLCEALHAAGNAHSIEIWSKNQLVGGVYGISLGRAFFGESMFSRERDASKVALAHLVDRLNTCGFTLFDVQFLTPHLASLGAIEIPRLDYRARLAEALKAHNVFPGSEMPADGQDVVQRITQTS